MTEQEAKEAAMAERIRALLAKAESSEHQAEADLFFDKAQELMTKYAIDEAVLRAKATGAKEVPIKKALQVERLRDALRATILLRSVARANDVRVVRNLSDSDGRRRRYSEWLIGFPSDVAFVELLWTSLLVQAAGAETRAWRHHGPRVGYSKTATERNHFTAAFMDGFNAAVGSRLRDAAERVVRSEGESVALVLRDKKHQVDDAVPQLLPHLRKMVIRGRPTSGPGRIAGERAGANADLSGGRGTVGGTRGQLR